MNILLELSKRQDEWVKMATKICGCKDKARDLVQDMYLKVGQSELAVRKEYSNFIYTVMDNIEKDRNRRDNSFVEDKKRVFVLTLSLEEDIVKNIKDKLTTNPNELEY